jgi:hypothetical protein
VNIATVLTAAGGLIALTGGSFGVVQFADSRYAPLAAVEDLAYSQLKKDIRELRDRIEAAQGQEKRNLEADLAELIDRLCRNYPEDRECP